MPSCLQRKKELSKLPIGSILSALSQHDKEMIFLLVQNMENPKVSKVLNDLMIQINTSTKEEDEELKTRLASVEGIESQLKVYLEVRREMLSKNNMKQAELELDKLNAFVLKKGNATPINANARVVNARVVNARNANARNANARNANAKGAPATLNKRTKLSNLFSSGLSKFSKSATGTRATAKNATGNRATANSVITSPLTNSGISLPKPLNKGLLSSALSLIPRK